jgi:hypothetical protein
MPGEDVSGHWLYAFLRRDAKSGQAFMVVANFHGTETLRGVTVRMPHDAQMFAGFSGDELWTFHDRLAGEWSLTHARDALARDGLPLPDLAPCSAMLIEIGRKLD